MTINVIKNVKNKTTYRKNYEIRTGSRSAKTGREFQALTER
ncbi:hypothetical protein MATR_11360 [Marivirga tractuosa]|uniref:Uncharacterized protein n=1 Tax=Marivirga tractuosa (strain ATCC 23168 / DSM 4126 / NBRC 15989 / NCIMB 1408 / VKM B-1430 / H-43) TaxID=643867 RepID=E4TKR9_MARTH|nr:hypothetical protein Ftrac_1244 [Marivirga tractuosa DSM 4126]BDD14311.1 hypothetical protein MATR_11360 [Marivirga tractuosa]